MLLKGGREDLNQIDFIVIGDVYYCPRCGREVILDFGSPILNNGSNNDKLKAIRNSRKMSIKVKRL